MSMITNTVNHFCTMNDIVINSRKISKFKTPTGNGKGRGQEHDEAYSREEIQKLLNVAPLRMKVCILVYASTGMRKGALASIQLRHLEKIEDNENFYKITVYPGTREQYIAFTTPKCSKSIDEYFDYETDPSFMKIHQCPNRKDTTNEYCCYECIRRKKKRFRTYDVDEYKKHFKQNHDGKTWYLNKADLQRHGWKAQGKPREGE